MLGTGVEIEAAKAFVGLVHNGLNQLAGVLSWIKCRPMVGCPRAPWP